MTKIFAFKNNVMRGQKIDHLGRQGATIVTNNFAFEVKVDLCLKYTFTGGGGAG